MFVTNRGIVIIMTNPQKTVFLIKKSCIYANKSFNKKINKKYGLPLQFQHCWVLHTGSVTTTVNR